MVQAQTLSKESEGNKRKIYSIKKRLIPIPKVNNFQSIQMEQGESERENIPSDGKEASKPIFSVPPKALYLPSQYQPRATLPDHATSERRDRGLLTEFYMELVAFHFGINLGCDLM